MAGRHRRLLILFSTGAKTMTLGCLLPNGLIKIGAICTATTILFCTQALAQDRPESRAHLEITRITLGAAEQDVVARACTKTAIAAVRAHASGQLSTVVNEAAKLREVGSSDNPFFNELVSSMRLDTSDEFLFMSLVHAQPNIMWLEQLLGADSGDKELMFTAYLAARCGFTAEALPGN